MFRRIVITLTGPICGHPQDYTNLSWTPFYSQSDNKYGLKITCDRCGAILEVPPDKFIAMFSLQPPDTPEQQTQPAPVCARRDEHFRQPVTHSKEFTPFDRKFLKRWKIRIDEE